MSKPFKTHRQQLSILRERGIDIPKSGGHGSMVMRTLERENYYNIINGYKTPFLTKDAEGKLVNPEKYIENTKFDELYSVFKMDRKLRSLILEYLLLIETHLKTSISHKFSEKFQQSNSYLDIQNYSKDPDKIITVVSTIATLSGVIKWNVNKGFHKHDNLNSIEHYLMNHQEVPLWVLVNYLTVGNMCYFYESIDDDLADDIAAVFASRYKKERNSHIAIDRKEISELLHIVKNYRNVCAHEDRFYDFKVRPPKLSKYIKAYNRERSIKTTNEESQKGNLFTLLLILRFYLNKNDYTKLLKKIKAILIHHKDDFSEISYRHILKELGLEQIKFKKLEEEK